MAACTDTRISTGLPGHPKTQMLIRRLGPSGAWGLVCLFLWAAANRTDGNLSGMVDEYIELAAGWQGEPGALASALVDVGFLDGAELARRIHDWADHNPWAAGAETRSAKARWNAMKRHHGEAEANRLVPEWAAIRAAEDGIQPASSNADSKQTAILGSNAPSPSPSPSPSPLPLPLPSPNQQQKQSRKRAPSQTSLPDDFAISDRVRRWATEKGHDRLDEHLESFRAKAAAKGYTYADWDSAFMEAIRENWAKLPAANVVAMERRPGGGRRAL